jgi:hypothetical protein
MKLTERNLLVRLVSYIGRLLNAAIAGVNEPPTLLLRFMVAPKLAPPSVDLV